MPNGTIFIPCSPNFPNADVHPPTDGASSMPSYMLLSAASLGAICPQTFHLGKPFTMSSANGRLFQSGILARQNDIVSFNNAKKRFVNIASLTDCFGHLIGRATTWARLGHVLATCPKMATSWTDGKTGPS